MRVEIFPLARPRRRIGKVTKLLKQAKRLFSEMENLLIRILGKPPGLSDVMRKAALAPVHKIFINPVIVTDQNPLPLPDELIEHLTGAARMDQI